MQKEEYKFYKDYYLGYNSKDLLSDEEQLIINKFDYYLNAKIPTKEFIDEAQKCGGLEVVLANPALIKFFADQYNVEQDLIRIKLKYIIKNLEQKKTR